MFVTFLSQLDKEIVGKVYMYVHSQKVMQYMLVDALYALTVQ